MNAASLDKSKRLQNDIQEEWRPVVGYEGIYEVSNKGNFRSFDRLITDKNKNSRTIKGKELSPGIDNDGYYVINLSKNGKKKQYKAHRVVAGAFLENPDNLPQINHIDEIKTNNSIDNLEWCDGRHNSEHSNAKWFVFYNEGIEVHIHNLNKFCEENGICAGTMFSLHYGKLKSHNGWTLSP